jgi:hypothetical protein
MRWNFEIKMFWTLQLKLQNNHTTLYISKKGCVFNIFDQIYLILENMLLLTYRIQCRYLYIRFWSKSSDRFGFHIDSVYLYNV